MDRRFKHIAANTWRQWIFMILCCFCTSANAQNLDYTVHHISAEQGLSDHRVAAILQHSNGFTYFGSFKGVDRFDGYRCVPLKLPERLRYNGDGSIDASVHFLFEALDGRLIIIYGLYQIKGHPVADLYNPKTGDFEEIRIADLDIAEGHIFLEDEETLDFIPRKYYNTPDHFRIDDAYGNRFEAIQSSKTAILTLANGQQLDFSAEWYSLILPSIFGRDYSKMFYFSNRNGLLKIDIHQSPFQTVLKAESNPWEYPLSSRAILPLDSNRVLLSTDTKPVVLYDRASDSLEDFPIDLKSPTGESLPLTGVRAFHLESDSIIWMTTYDQLGLIKLNLNTGETSSYLQEYNDQIYKLIHSIQLPSGELLILINFEVNKNLILLFDPKTGTSQMIHFLSSSLSIGNQRVTYAIQTADEHIWIGTTMGLYEIDLKAAKILRAFYGRNRPPLPKEAFPQTYALAANSVLVLHENEENQLLIGLEGGGLQILDLATGDLETIDQTKGLSSNTVCGILPDQNGYWISTYNGLSFYQQEKKTFQNFSFQNGMPHHEFNRFSFQKDPTGRLYFGGMNGFVHFDPAEVLAPKGDVNLLLSEATYFAEDGQTQIQRYTGFEEIPVIHIPSGNRICSFFFTMDDFVQAEGHQYAYLLQPRYASNASSSSQEWRSNGQNPKIQFDYLPAGDYELRVRGTTASGLVSEEFRIYLVVEEFFYRTIWFYLLVTLGIAGISYAFYRNRLNQVIKMEKLRIQLSSDLHDDVGSLLSGVAYQMEVLEYYVDEKHKSRVQRVASASRRAMSQMRDVVWAMDQRKDSLQDLVDRMREFTNEVLEPLDIHCQFQTTDLPLQKILSTEQRHAFLLIFKEAINNTIKHAAASKIEVQFFRKNRHLILSIQDNGQGLQKDIQSITGQGLSNMQMRAERISGQIRFFQEDGFGLHLSAPIF